MLAKIKLEQSCASQVQKIAQDTVIRTDRRIFKLRKKGVSSLDWVGLKEQITQSSRKKGKQRLKEETVYLVGKVGVHAQEYLPKSQRKKKTESKERFRKKSEAGGEFFKINYGNRVVCRGVFGIDSEFASKKIAIKVFENELKAARMINQFQFE